MATTAGLGEADATAAWGYTTALALLIVAVIGPVLGSYCDQARSKKRFLVFFAGLGICASALFVFLGDDDYLLGSALFIAGNIGFAAGNIFYESLLPHVARPGDLDRVSTRGYAMGYVGGGILLVINLLWVMHPGWFLLPGTGFALRLTFFSVAVWWAVFTVPLLRRVEEPRLSSEGEGDASIGAALSRLAETFREVRRYRQLLLFLVAFWVYNDGIGTIIKMAIAYGDEVGIGRNDLITALVVTQFVGIPCTFLFGRLAGVLGTKRSILAGLGVYTLMAVGGYFMEDRPALLHPRGDGRPRAGRHPGLEPLPLRLDDPAGEVGRVLRLLQHQLPLRRDLRPPDLRLGEPDRRRQPPQPSSRW